MTRRTSLSPASLFGIVIVSLVSALLGAPLEPELHMVVMRDGTRLATDVYLPQEGEPPYPVILMRTPYGRGGGRGVAQRYAARGYAVVAQDIRGRGDSEGHHAIIFHNGGWGKRRDGHDTLAWIADQAWCNGKVGTTGGSALGITQNMLAPGAPEVLKCQAISVAFSDMYHQAAYQGGVWRKSLLEGWLAGTGMVDVNQRTFRDHPNDDAFWAELDPEEQAERVHAPGMFVGGWYDIFLQGTINGFVEIQNKGGPEARGRCRLVIAPIAHGGFDQLTYPRNARLPEAADEGRWFDHWLKSEDNSVSLDKPVHYYVMGDPTDSAAPGNFWRAAEAWPPPAETVPFYFHADGSLVRDRKPHGEEALSYRYDPADPVPTVGGQNLLLPKGPMDQRSIESRPDVLLFTTEALEEAVEVTGRLHAKLFVSSDAPDTDFSVKLTDVYPDGRSMLVTDGVLSAEHRESFAEPRPLQSHKVYTLTVDLWSTSLVFNKGHRIRVAVSSSNAPRFEAHASPAVNTLHLSSEHPSHVLLPIYKGEK